MIKIFTQEEFNKSKLDDKLELECIFCHKHFFKDKYYIQLVINGWEGHNCNFCSRKCNGEFKKTGKIVKCKNCQIDFYKKNSDLTENNFCSHSCSSTFNNKNRIRNPEKEKIRREKIRTKILEKISNGWEIKSCGRCKKIDYHSEIAGDVKLDGGWELATAKYFDSINVKWIRNKQRFEYWNSIKNTKSTYCPDFYVEDWNKFIEVKGYKTDLDDIKWKQFTGDLEIWDGKRLKELGIKAKWL